MFDVAVARARLEQSFHLTPGPIADTIAARAPEAAYAAMGLWKRDPSVWSTDAEVQKKILTRLGWIDSPQLMADALDRLLTFAGSIKSAGFTDVVLLGMGGSSLAPEVLRGILGIAPGWPRLHMLDSTDPTPFAPRRRRPSERCISSRASRARRSSRIRSPRIFAARWKRPASRSGRTTSSHHGRGDRAAVRAKAEGFRDLFINPSDIGGRYSAMSFFGMVPAALMGQDVAGLVDWARAMLASPHAAVDLGLAMGAAAAVGRDKLTLVLTKALEPFGLWVEQLIAESTGKHGAGIVPIAGETLAPPAAYGRDRLFVRVRPRDLDVTAARETDTREVEAAQFPIADIQSPEPSALGAEFVRWEIATAIAGALLHINPFDEPNVQQAKDATKKLLTAYRAGQLPAPVPDRRLENGVSLTLSTAARQGLHGREPEALLTLIGEKDYAALLAYVGPDVGLAEELRSLRLAIRDRTRAATMFGYGPRYLHSTGQLHKGGPNTGVFVLVSATPAADLAIPGEPFSFGTLEFAQALGDFASLDATGRRALHVRLPSPDRRLLHDVADRLLSVGSGFSRTV